MRGVRLAASTPAVGQRNPWVGRLEPMASGEQFLPSRHALGFTNSWPRQPAVHVPTPWGRLALGNAGNGLCGGMVFAAADYFHAGRAAPVERPEAHEALYRFVVRRIVDSWHPPGGVARYYAGMLRADSDLLARTRHREWPRITAALDRGVPVPLGLVTVSSANPKLLRHNHQVLAYAHEQEESRWRLWVYDPNRGPRDDIAVTLEADASAGFTHNLGISRTLRGLFRVSYTPTRPPDSVPLT